MAQRDGNVFVPPGQARNPIAAERKPALIQRNDFSVARGATI
jgi:hypothetical protein